MKKLPRLSHLVLVSLVLMSCSLYSRDSLGTRSPFLPLESGINSRLGFRWFLNDGFNARFIEQSYNGLEVSFKHNISLTVQHKTFFRDDAIHHHLSDLRVSYRKLFTPEDNIPILEYGTFLYVKAGVFEWFPTHTNVQQIIENAEAYITPPIIYGGSGYLRAPLLKDRSLQMYLGAHSGDLINNEAEAELFNAFLHYEKTVIFNLGVSARAGKAQASKHLVNHAYLFYRPKMEKLSLDIQAGKLPAYDQSPYGIHLGMYRDFKYVRLGGYYQRRLNQQTKGEIAGVSWNITGPPRLAKIVNSFNIIYDFNTNTIWMWMPLLKLDIEYK